MNAPGCPPSTLTACGSRKLGQLPLPSPSPQLAPVLSRMAVRCWEERHRPDCRSVDVAEAVVAAVGIATLVKAVWERLGDSDVVDGYAMHGGSEEMSSGGLPTVVVVDSVGATHGDIARSPSYVGRLPGRGWRLR